MYVISTSRVSIRRVAPELTSISWTSPETMQRSLQMASMTATYFPDGEAAGRPN